MPLKATGTGTTMVVVPEYEEVVPAMSPRGPVQPTKEHKDAAPKAAPAPTPTGVLPVRSSYSPMRGRDLALDLHEVAEEEEHEAADDTTVAGHDSDGAPSDTKEAEEEGVTEGNAEGSASQPEPKAPERRLVVPEDLSVVDLGHVFTGAKASKTVSHTKPAFPPDADPALPCVAGPCLLCSLFFIIAVDDRSA